MRFSMFSWIAVAKLKESTKTRLGIHPLVTVG
jgi:hypothetical protein